MTEPRGARRRRAGLLIVVLVLAVGTASTGGPAAADANESPSASAAFRSISGGFRHTCGLANNGTVRCWGANHAGQLGQGTTTAWGDTAGELGGQVPPIDLGTGRTATAITSGDDHSCALLDDATVKCWGANTSGQLGQTTTGPNGDAPGEMGDDLPPISLGTGRTALSIAAGAVHTCALLDDFTVKCWGNNGFGQLGIGDAIDRGVDGSMGDALPVVSLGTGRSASTITAGDSQTCALLDNGTLKCWGNGDKGRLGLGDEVDRGDDPGEMGDALPAVSLGSGRTALTVTTGYGHTCAILDDQTLKCWGEASQGRLGLGDEVHRGDQPGEMGDALPTVPLGTGRTVTGVTAGNDGTCALLDDGTVRCWGSNADGQNGLGADQTEHRGDQPGEMGDALPAAVLGRPATAVTGGGLFFCARLDTSQVKCWGWNPNGQLGIGTTENQGDDPGEMAALPVTIALQPVYRPDGLLRRAAFAFVGNDVHNTTGTGQTRSATVGNQGAATFTLRAQNDGNFTDALRIRGTGTTSRFTVTYRRGATNITAQVLAGTYTLPGVAPGRTRDITVVIRARAGTPAGTTVSRTITTRSGTNPAIRDTVKATITRR